MKSGLNIEHIQKKMTLIANVFPKLRSSKYVVWSISKKYHFRVPLDKQHGNWAQTLLKTEQRHVYHIYRPLWKQLSLKKCLLVIYKILRLFINTFTAHEKIFPPNKEILTEPIKKQLSQKQKNFSPFFSCSLKT